MTLNQSTNYTPKHARDMSYQGKRRKVLSTPDQRRLADVDYRPDFMPKHCLGASSSRAARDLGCQHAHPLKSTGRAARR